MSLTAALIDLWNIILAEYYWNKFDYLCSVNVYHFCEYYLLVIIWHKIE